MKNKEEKLKQVFSKLFDVNADDINEISSMNTVEGWDSMKHIMLVFAIEEEFGISLDVDESVEMTSYIAIKKVLNKHGVEI